MREIQRSALVAYSPAQIFALVDDIESYPKFLPWVADAQLLERHEFERIGSLTIARAGMRERIVTRNSVQPPHRLTMTLIEGPFKVLEGNWSFDAVGAQSSTSDSSAQIETQNEIKGTRIGLHMRFEFKNRMTDLLLAKTFEASCDSLVDAFCQRAREVYGRSVSL